MTVVSPYLVGLVVVMMGGVGILVIMLRVLVACRRKVRLVQAYTQHMGSSTGLIRARFAALRLALSHRAAADDKAASTEKAASRVGTEP